MSFLKKLFSKTEEQISTNDEFWDWFLKNEKDFFKIIKEKTNIEKPFFSKLSSKLNKLKDGYFYLTGMYDDDTVELIFTADGEIKNIVFVEDLVKSAPVVNGWKFTALKPELELKNVLIKMAGYEFGGDNISFYSNDHSKYPDYIDITFVHDDLNKENKSQISMGTCIFLDNYLGELKFATSIDAMNFVTKRDATKELIPIEKLKDFLKWRYVEFTEKYDDIKHSTEDDTYSALESMSSKGFPVIAIINSDILSWENKASHPWILNVKIKYDGSKNNGLPNQETYQLLNNIEDDIQAEFKNTEGILNIGRQTAENVREIYFACKDFRKPSKTVFEIKNRYNAIVEIDYEIYKDKYWRSFERFTYVG